MKVGIITTPTVKGQVVIPKEFREKLGISPDKPIQMVLRGDGIYLFPVASVVRAVDSENSYLKILEKTKGTWGTIPRQDHRKRKALELAASKRRKRPW